MSQSPARVCTLGLSLCLFMAATPGAHASPHSRSHAVDRIDLPRSSAEAASFAIDVNGDGSRDNAFGNVLVVLSGSLQLDFYAGTASAVAAGQVVHLVELRSRDADFTVDPAAEAGWYVGEPTLAPPLFDGTDNFRYEAIYPPGNFFASLTAGGFVSANPVTTNAPVDVTVVLRIGTNPMALPMQGARLEFTTTPSGLAEGQLNGSIRTADIEVNFVPALASALDQVVQDDPGSDIAMTLLQIFDHDPADGMIGFDEVRAHPLIVGLLAPDVQIRDANGNYAPNPANSTPDALSFGFGFTAISSPALLPRIFIDDFES